MRRQGISTPSTVIAPQQDQFEDQEGHREALATLLYTITQSEGWALVVGRAGAGKTQLAARLRASLGPEVRYVQISAEDCPAPLDLFRHISEALEMGVPCHYKARFLFSFRACIEQCHRQGQKILILVDGAQSWGPEMLREVELLGDEDHFSPRVLNIFLFARPEFLGTLEGMGATNLKHHLRRFRRLPHPDEPARAPGERRHHQRVGGRIDYFDQQAVREMHQIGEAMVKAQARGRTAPVPAATAQPSYEQELKALMDQVLGTSPSR